MFALLTVVKGALPQNDLMEICDLSVFDLEDLPQAIRRWFLHSEAGWQFQHPRLADGFRCALRRDAERMEQRLLEYCAQWRTHMSRYALRYYAAHLAKRAKDDTASAKQLYALMEDEAFLQAQRKAFPDEPELPLSLLQGAIEAASARDEPVPLASALLLHAQRAQGFRRQSPYRIWRETGNLEYALKVADLYHPQVRPIWYLLLASEYSDPNQRKDILNRLPRSFTRLSDEYTYSIFVLLMRLAEDIDEGIFVCLKPLLSEKSWLDWLNRLIEAERHELVTQWLEWFLTHFKLSDSRNLSKLARIQVGLGLYHEALQTAQLIKEAKYRSEVLVAIAEAQAQAGLIEDAQRTLQQALQTAQRIEEAWNRSEALRVIAKAQTQAGLFEDAIQTAQLMEEALARSEALRATAKAQAQAGLFEDAIQTAQRIEEAWAWSEVLVAIAKAQAQAGLFEDAIQTAQRIEKAWARSEVLVAIAEAQAQAGLIEDAQRTFQQALQTAQLIEEGWYQHGVLVAVGIGYVRVFWGARHQSEVLVAIAEAQAQAGLFEDAIQTAQMIKRAGNRIAALRAIAKAQAQAGLIEDAQRTSQQALQTAQRIEEWALDERSEVLAAIAEAQAQAGLLEDAIQTAQQLMRNARDAVLCVIAKAQVRAGLYHEAFQTAQMIEEAWDRSEALRAIAKAQAQAGLIEDAQRTSQQALQTAQRIEESEAWNRSDALRSD
jgi:hypothetical protein